jgi:hypothetical protein
MKISPLLLLCGCLAACSGSTGGVPITGTYAGTYGGADNGSIVLNIVDSGSLTLSATSSFWHTTFNGTGSVSADDRISGTGAGGLVSITFLGSVGSGTASGTWTASNGATGTWSTTRN